MSLLEEAYWVVLSAIGSNPMGLALTRFGIFPSERVRNTRPSDDPESGTGIPQGLEAKMGKSSKR